MMSKKQLLLKSIPAGTIRALQDLAERRGCSVEQVLQDAVNTEFYITEQLEQGSTILCKNSEGETRRVVFTHLEE